MRAIQLASIISLATVSVAWGAPFQVLSWEGGSSLPGVNGSGFTTSSGGFYIDRLAFPGAIPPLDLFALSPTLEWTTYFSLDDFGPSALFGSSTANFYTGWPASGYESAQDGFLTVSPGQHITGNVFEGAIGRTPQPFFSGFAPLATGGRSLLDGVFIGRFTVSRNATLSGDIMLFINGIGGTENQIVALGGPPALLDGQQIVLTAFLIAQPNVLPGFGDADVYDVWAHIIDPCPPAGPPFTTAMYEIVGTSTGAGWSWKISSPSADFQPIEDISAFSAVSANSFQLALDFSSSINTASAAAGCTSSLISSVASFGGSDYLVVRVGGTSVFDLCFGAFGGPVGTCCAGPFTVGGAPCSFNPTIELTELPGLDCNNNGQDDIFDIIFDGALDANGNGAIDTCECLGDADGDGVVDFGDVTSVLSNWLNAYTPFVGPGDANLNGVVEFSDITTILAEWGKLCP